MRKLKFRNPENGGQENIENLSKIRMEGPYLAYTVGDLRDVVRELLNWKKRVEVAANEMIDAHTLNGWCSSALVRLEKELGE